MKLSVYLKKLSVENKEGSKRSLKGILEFRTETFVLCFIFDVLIYIMSLCMGLLVLMLYYKEIKIYSNIKNKIIEILNLNEILKFLIYDYGKIALIILIGFLLIYILIMLIFMYKIKTRKEFKRWIRIFLYHRINFIINYYIFIKLFNITAVEFIEYNIIIIIIFIIYIVMHIICVILKKENKIKILHYLNWPWLSLGYWIFLYLNLTDKSVFERTYDDFAGYDDKYYDIAYIVLNKKLKVSST